MKVKLALESPKNDEDEVILLPSFSIHTLRPLFWESPSLATFKDWSWMFSEALTDNSATFLLKN